MKETKVAEAARDYPTYRDVDAIEAIIHPSAVVSAHAHVGNPGEWIGHPSRFPAVICAGAVVREAARVHAGCERHTLIGEDALIMSGAYIGHDTRIGASTRVAPNAVVGGCVTIGRNTSIGLGAIIRPHVIIGDNVRVGAGAVVTKNIPNGETWVGIPARRLHKWTGGDES